ncbi:MAG: hemolysin family protein [Acidimicrobiales bacterium]
MSIGTALGFAAVLLLVLANAFFVASEFGLIAVDRARLANESEKGSGAARRVERLNENLSYHLSGSQLGITTSSLVLGFIAKPTIAAQLEPLLDGVVSEAAVGRVSVVLAVALATGFQMVVGELVPKTIAIDRPYEMSTRLGRAIGVWGFIAKPIITTFDAAANWQVRLLGMEPVEELEQIRSIDEIERLIVASAVEGTLDEDDVTLFRRSVRLAEKTAAEALVPRTEVIALDVDDHGADLLHLAATTGHSRFPIFGDDADDVRGVVHVKSIYEIERTERPAISVLELATSPVFVPESVDLDDLLLFIRTVRNHLMVVVDEHGGTAGIITLEDILEELVGEIDDEYDIESPILTRVEERGSFVVSGSLHQDEVHDACGFDMPEGEYETLAGFVLDQLGRIPEPGARFTYDGWRVEVVAVHRRRVASIRLAAPVASATGVQP